MENTLNSEARMTVFITGTSSGFGRETAKLFQRNGWNVIATMRSPELEQELSGLENVLVTKLDVQDPGSIDHAVAAGIAKFGKIDVLVNNAGYGLMGVFESATIAQIKQQYAVNVFGLMEVTQAVLPFLRANGSGAIVNISTFGGVAALPFGTIYNSSKFAVEGFSEGLSHELSSLNIAVKIVEPGGVATNFRNSIEMINNEIPQYGPLLGGFFARYAQVTEHTAKATVEDVAATIFLAATDRTTKLRYVIGDDSQFYIDTKIKNEEETFLKKMRGYFFS